MERIGTLPHYYLTNSSAICSSSPQLNPLLPASSTLLFSPSTISDTNSCVKIDLINPTKFDRFRGLKKLFVHTPVTKNSSLIGLHSRKQLLNPNLPFGLMRKWFGLNQRQWTSKSCDPQQHQSCLTESLSSHYHHHHQQQQNLSYTNPSMPSISNSTMFTSSRDNVLLATSSTLTQTGYPNPIRLFHPNPFNPDLNYSAHQGLECIVTAMVEEFPSDHGNSSTQSLDSVYHMVTTSPPQPSTSSSSSLVNDQNLSTVLIGLTESRDDNDDDDGVTCTEANSPLAVMMDHHHHRRM